HVRDVGDERGLVALVLEEALEQREDHVRARVPDVNGPVDGGSAGVDRHLAGIARLELADPAGERVLDADLARHQPERSTVAIASAAIPSSRPMKPSPSLVVNFTFTSSGCRPTTPASLPRISS